MRSLLCALFMLALPATAQELSDRFQVIGEMAVTLDGTDMVLPIVVDLDNNRSSADIRPLYGSLTMLGVTGFTPTDQGEIGPPMITIVIQVSGGGAGTLMSIVLVEKGRSFRKPTEADMSVGSIELAEFSTSEDGTTKFSYSGELIRMVLDADQESTPEEGQPPVVEPAYAMLPEAGSRGGWLGEG